MSRFVYFFSVRGQFMHGMLSEQFDKRHRVRIQAKNRFDAFECEGLFGLIEIFHKLLAISRSNVENESNTAVSRSYDHRHFESSIF